MRLESLPRWVVARQLVLTTETESRALCSGFGLSAAPLLFHAVDGDDYGPRHY
jgi:hypothetical protein